MSSDPCCAANLAHKADLAALHHVLPINKKGGRRRTETQKLTLISQKMKLAEAIRQTQSHWFGLTRFIDDGRIEMDTNIVERSIRPITLNRKHALFAGSDGGGETGRFSPR